MTHDKKVKILATLGPATRSVDDVRALVEAGVNLFRLNFSHGEHSDHAERFAWIRQVEQELNQPIGILMDLQGPSSGSAVSPPARSALSVTRPFAWTWTRHRATAGA